VPVTLVVHGALESTEGAPATDALEPITFDAPRIVLGRGASCDVRLPDASVSGRHASIRARDAGYTVVDEGSTNGTRLNGEKLTAQAPRPLKSGDELVLGRVRLTVRIGAARPSPKEATHELALQLVARALGDEVERRTAIVVLEGPDEGARLELADGSRTLGRDPRCNLRLTDRAVPPIAVEVTLTGTRVRVSLRDDRGQARLGERPLVASESLPWHDGVVLTIGSTRLRLDDPIARALDRSSAGDDEKVVVVAKSEPPPEAAAPAPASALEEVIALPTATPKPRVDRRGTWRGATVAFEVIALILGLIVLGLSAAGFYWLLKK
jgi:predicted component of type VI protein secretion system